MDAFAVELATIRRIYIEDPRTSVLRIENRRHPAMSREM